MLGEGELLAMSTARLRPCPTCARHARISEHACPFCGHRFDDTFRDVLPPRASTRRLTRAALLALGSGTAVLGPSCASSVSSANLVAPYGAPPDGGIVEADVSACVAAGGDCSDGAACDFSIEESCGSGGGACCVPCEADPNVQRISVSSYSQTCTVDSDCVAIGVGDPCHPCDILCRDNAAINKSSLTEYTKDIAASPALGNGATCACAPTSLSVCCNAGTCDPSCGVDGSTGPIQGFDADLEDADLADADLADADLADAGLGGDAALGDADIGDAHIPPGDGAPE
jgi:hypothetical protein